MLRQWSPYAIVTVTVGDYAPAARSIVRASVAGRHRDQVVVIEGDSDDLEVRGDLVLVGTVRALWDLAVQVRRP